MDSKTEKQVIRVLKNHLIKNRKVNVPKLGTFEVIHKKQQQEQRPDGQVVLSPPKDELIFRETKSSG